jgi:membrane protein DedA with SNARE-associated domain
MDYTELISTYGYAGLFGLLMLGVVGLPVPDEALLTFTGYLCFKGELQISAAIGTAWLGTSCGITMSYVLGRIIGVRAIGRVAGVLHASTEDLDRVHRWLQRRGAYMLPAAYFMPGIRHLAALFTGVSGSSFTQFAVFAYTGALLWCSTFIGVGYVLGSEWSRFSRLIHSGVFVLSLAVIVAIMVSALVMRQRRASGPKAQ